MTTTPITRRPIRHSEPESHKKFHSINPITITPSTTHQEAISEDLIIALEATENEKDTTRARANVLREVLTTNDAKNKFDSAQLKEVFDLCISCKACGSECPSNVDMATSKAEFLYQYQKTHGVSRATKLFANSSKYTSLAAKMPRLTNE